MSIPLASALQDGGRASIPASFEMRFSPSDHLISIVRRFVLSFYGSLLADDELSSQLALATHELLDNAVKYGSTPTAELAVSITRDDEEALRIVVAIRNQAGREHISEAGRMIAAIQEAASIFDFYQELLHLAAVREHGSGLGLARIAAETNLGLTSRVDGDTIEIRAETRIPSTRSP